MVLVFTHHYPFALDTVDICGWMLIVFLLYFLLQGILSSVYLDGEPIHKWKMLSVPFQKIPEVKKMNPILKDALPNNIKISSHKKLKINLGIFTMLVL